MVDNKPTLINGEHPSEVIGQPSGRVKMKKVDIAYLAGVVDSDGCISIQKRRNCRSYGIILTIVQRDLPLIEYLYSVFQGSVNVVSTPRKGYKDFYLRWVVSDTTAIKLLKLILPYLRLKAEQAKTVVELYNEKMKKKDSKIDKRSYTDDSINRQRELFIYIKSLNSPATTERVGSLTREMRQSELVEMKNRQRDFRSESPLNLN